jgi:hypothetical protein
MDYSPSRITTVVIGFAKRKIYHVGERLKLLRLHVDKETYYSNETYNSKIIDLTNSKIGRITNEIKETQIISILGNNFYEKTVKNFHTVKELLSYSPDYIMTDYGVTLGSFRYFYGIYQNKFIAGELINLPLDMVCFPIRNMKHKNGLVVEALVDENKYIIFKDEFDNTLELRNQTCGNIKVLLVGEKKQIFLITNPYFDNTNIIPYLNDFLKNNPSYLIYIDNGRYSHYQIEEINKEKYMENSFEDYDDLFVFGEIK